MQREEIKKRSILGVIGAGLSYIFHLAWQPADNAVQGWFDDKLAGHFGLQAPSVQEVISFCVGWAPPMAAGMALTYGAFRIGRSSSTRLNPGMPANPPAYQSPKIAIVLGPGDGFEKLERPSADSCWRIVLVAIENSGDAMATNCQLLLEWFDNADREQRFLNATNFTVSPGRKYFCSIASYDEAKVSSENRGRIKLHFLRGAFDSHDFWPAVTKRHYITLRFTCSEMTCSDFLYQS
jgi:hypothetical protein